MKKSLALTTLLTLLALALLVTAHTPSAVADPDEDALLDQLHKRFIDAANDREGLVDRMLLFADEVRPISGASERGVSLLLKGIEQTIVWSRIKPLDLLVAYRDMRRMTAQDYWGIAVFCHRQDLDRDAEQALWDALRKDATQKDDIDIYLATIKGIANPDGGFIPMQRGGRGFFVSPAERESWEIAGRVEDAVDAVNDGKLDAAAEQKLVDELNSFKPEARAGAAKLMIARAEELKTEFKRARLDLGNLLKDLQSRIERARKDALRVINSARSYPPHDEDAQKRVNDLVKKVRDIWEHPALAAAMPASVRKKMAHIQALYRIGAAIDPSGGITTEDARAFETEFLGLLNEKLFLGTHSPDRGERSNYEQLVQINRDNMEGRSPATEAEREHSVILNTYRVMMGLAPIRISPKLTKSAHSHSEYMARTKKFAHNIPGHPDGASPTDRARRQGYRGGGAENISRMDEGGLTPLTAFESWFGSAGHHRNMLNRRHRVVGIGADAAGSRWTQQFGARTDGGEPRAGR